MTERTVSNLMAAFAGESQANRKYLAYAKKAEKEGKLNAARLFRAVAEAEAIHALKELERAGQVGTTAENLAAAIAGENYENVTMYPDFAAEADADGQAPVAKLFRMIAEVEGVHEALFTKALAALEDDSEELTFFVCPFCGYVELGRPDKCPVCGAPGEKFIEAA